VSKGGGLVPVLLHTENKLDEIPLLPKEGLGGWLGDEDYMSNFFNSVGMLMFLPSHNIQRFHN
jgi:hypothetical protein